MSKVARRLRVAPLAARRLKSWPRFMINYALGLVPGTPYRFRNGALLQIGRGIDHAPIVEIFLREEYGSVADSAVILDLGASAGTFCVYAATTARGVRIYAYEPMADSYRLMVDNIRLNRLESVVTCFNCAVAADSRTRQLFVKSEIFSFPTLVAPERGSGSSASLETPCTTLSDILDSNRLERVDLLKMDCEGSEYEILYGTPAAYFDRIKEIRMEYHNLQPDRHNVNALAAFLCSRGYEITMVQRASAPEVSGNLWARRDD